MNDFPGGLEITNEVTRAGAQGSGDLHERIHRRRFPSTLNPAYEYRREVGFLRQPLLAQVPFLALGTNRLTQEAAVLLNSWHSQFKKQEAPNVAMSLTTIFMQLGGCNLPRGSHTHNNMTFSVLG